MDPMGCYPILEEMIEFDSYYSIGNLVKSTTQLNIVSTYTESIGDS